jgi:uncharacterized protein
VIAPDINILLYAHRAEARAHRAYRRWLEELVSGPQPFAISVLVAAGFVRVATNPRIYPNPVPLPTALAQIEHLIDQPTCRVVAPGPGHWQRVADLCRATRATGDLVADAQHAAVAMAEGCTWVTNDRDFAKFAPHGLKWEHLDLS